jgi:predicted aldo/keto reductase-like oxidoreductase
MTYRRLGQTGLTVSPIAFGTIPLKIRETPVEEGAELLTVAAAHGINFFDLAEIYGTYPHMREALKHIDRPVVIAAKSTAKDTEGMDRSIKTALDEIGVECLDIFKMHSVDSLDDLESRRPAWEALLKARSDGLVRAIGVSTHSCRVLEEIIRWDDVEVILAVLNLGLRGVLEGTMAESHALIREAGARGKGVYLMKVFGGGNSFASARESLEFALSIPEAASVAVGMQNLDEVRFNTAVASGREIAPDLQAAMISRPRKLHIRPFCKACWTCIEACRYDALSQGDKMPVIDEEKCILCGYCGFACPSMAIKII